MSGVEAAEWGLVNEAVPRRGLDARVAELARDIAAGAPLTARASKHGIRVVMENLAVDRTGHGGVEQSKFITDNQCGAQITHSH